MADITPFRGIRYNADRIKDLWAVLSPPWDKLTEKNASMFRAAHPNNIAHILVPDPSETQVPWPRSADLRFKQWCSDGLLREDPQKCFYAYRQRFQHEGLPRERLGYLALTRLGPPQVSGVHPHENVFPDHYQSRLQLLRETQTNFGPVYMIYSDPEEETTRLLTPEPQQEVIRVQDPIHDITHEMWLVSDTEKRRRLSELMKHRDVIIADGHHRFGSACEYASEWHAAHPHAPEVSEVDYRLAYLTPMENDGVIILPTHRVLREAALGLSEHMKSSAQDLFEILADSFDNERDLLSAMGVHRQKEPKRKVLGLFDGTRFTLLRWTGKTPDSYSTMHAHRSDVWKALDVNVLHEILLPEVLRWDKAADSHWVSHHREPEEVVETVRDHPGSLGVFLNRTSRLEVQAIALAGEKMPQKSTDFYPKIPTGLVFRQMNP